MANNVSAPITASLHYSCDFSASRRVSQFVVRESFEEKVERFLTPENIQVLGERQRLLKGALLQLQKPTEWNVYSYDGVKGGEQDIINDFLVVLGDEAGCYNYVASNIESKNSGRYQRLAKRVLSSQTYMVYKSSSGRYKLKLLLDNGDWLEAGKSLKAFRFLARVMKLKLDETSLKVVECVLRLPQKSVEIRAARVVDCVCDGVRKRMIMSLNSGKIWILEAENCDIKKDVLYKNLIMTNFVGLKKLSAEGDYVRV